MSFKNINIQIGSISNEEIVLFTKHLAVTLKSGINIIDALDMLLDPNQVKMSSMITDIMEHIKAGQALHETLEKHKKYFSDIYINLVKTGELSGNLEDNLSYLTEQLQKSQELKKKVKSAMIYPAFVIAAVFGLGFSVAIFVLPKILPLFKSLNVELPITTRMLIFTAELFQSHGLLIFIASTFAVLFFSFLLRREFIKPLTHRLVMITPIVRMIIKNVNLQSLSHTMSILLKSGITVDYALQIVMHSSHNVVYKNAIKRLGSRLD